MAQQKESTSEQLREELETLANTLEEILHPSGDKPKAELDKIRAKAEGLLKDTRTRLTETSGKMVDQTKEIADKADTYVHEKPWAGVGIGAAVGLVLGVLLTRR
ncbi:YqjD family protein [Jinshanibacter sp. LJY008]|uniref:YqjD family protein n=1 Tax=Limnobaculum eriocheiris TaxID=2897391 RepID=A0A9X1N1L7_9GAMM|nr:YqjD family protein [Limnobaculum eriocheiris]MCD1127692.1 YqjD family protein [Limnobaculum eriocheiris]